MGGSAGKTDSSSQGSGWNAGNTGGVTGGVNGTYGVNESGSSSISSSGSSQDVWGGQSPFLQDVYGEAQNAFQQGKGEVNALKPGVQDVMGSALAAGGAGYGNQMGGGFASGLQGQVGPNSYVNALKGDMLSDAQKIKAQNLGGLDARAAAAGMSGSSGYRDQTSKMMDNVDEQTMQGMNQLGFQAHNQGVQNQMNLANMQDRNQQAGLGNMGAMQQAAMAMFNPSMLGQQMAGQYAQTIGGPTTLSQSSSNNISDSFSNGFNSGFGVNGGYNYGNNYGGQTSNSKSKGREVGLELG
jgi:hypothetical protein